MSDVKIDESWMRLALECATKAQETGEVPVGALLVRDGKLLSSGWNRPVSSYDPTAHAEIAAIREACMQVGNYRLPNATLYVTLEPCVMCVGAIVHARISRLVFGANEQKAGAIKSKAKLLETHPFNWRVDVRGGILANECSEIISSFFRNRR